MSSSTENGRAPDSSKSVAPIKGDSNGELKRVRRFLREPRNRLLSDSSEEVPKGILKNPSLIPTKRSVSECIDDLSQIIEELNISIEDLPRATAGYCPHHKRFIEEDGDENEPNDEDNRSDSGFRQTDVSSMDESTNDSLGDRNYKKCDCNMNYSDNDGGEDKPKKSVHFDERVYETIFFASRLYDRRYFAKFHFSSRHHPPMNQNKSQNKNKSKSKRNHRSSLSSSGSNSSINGASTNSDCESSISTAKGLKTDTSKVTKLQTKSQRAKQSKKDKKKRLSKRDASTDVSGDDQGYCSSLHNLSD